MDTLPAPLPPRSALVGAYGQWLLALADDEMATGYPRLHALRDDYPTYFFELIAAWPEEQTRALLSAFIRRFTALYGGPSAALSDLEIGMHARFEFPSVRSPSVMAQQTRSFAGEFKLDKKLLQRTIKQRVEAALGVKGKSLDGAWRYVSQLDEVTVYTDLDFGRSSVQLESSQVVVPGRVDHTVGASRDQLLINCSVGNLLGLGTLDWSYISQDEIPSVANFIANSSLELIRAMPGIIAAARALAESEFPRIDRFINGVATSIKSISFTAPTYQNPSTFFARAAGYIDELSRFEGESFMGREVHEAAIQGRQLVLAVPAICSEAQLRVLRNLQAYGVSVQKPVEVTVVYPMRKCVGIYERQGKLILRASSRAANGLWAGTGECLVLGTDTAPGSIGEATRAQLAISGTLAPKSHVDLEPLFKAAGVSSWTTFGKGSKYILVAAEDDQIIVTPTDRNGGSYRHANAEALTIPADSDTKLLGETVLRALANSS